MYAFFLRQPQQQHNCMMFFKSLLIDAGNLLLLLVCLNKGWNKNTFVCKALDMLCDCPKQSINIKWEEHSRQYVTLWYSGINSTLLLHMFFFINSDSPLMELSRHKDKIWGGLYFIRLLKSLSCHEPFFSININDIGRFHLSWFLNYLPKLPFSQKTLIIINYFINGICLSGKFLF